MRVPVVDPLSDQAPLTRELVQAAERVIRSGRFILGPEVEAFEESLAAFVGARYAVGVSSGTDALLAALLASGVKAGDEVIVPALSFVASAECVVRAGATPRFVDVRPDTLNLDESRLDAALRPKVRAVIAVHLYGTPCEMDRIREIADARGVAVIEDAAQALGATFRERSAGTWGNIGCFSFFPSKPLGGLGDGGALVTDDPAIDAACRRIRHHGLSRPRGPCVEPGGNYRLDALQAALLSVKLPHLGQWLSKRRRHARAYDEALRGHEAIEPVTVPAHAQSAHCHYTIRVPDEHRAALAAHLEAQGVHSAVYYPDPLPAHPFLKRFAGEAPFETATRASRQVLSLPLYSSMSDDAREHVVRALSGYRFE